MGQTFRPTAGDPEHDTTVTHTGASATRLAIYMADGEVMLSGYRLACLAATLWWWWWLVGLRQLVDSTSSLPRFSLSLSSPVLISFSPRGSTFSPLCFQASFMAINHLTTGVLAQTAWTDVRTQGKLDVAQIAQLFGSFSGLTWIGIGLDWTTGLNFGGLGSDGRTRVSFLHWLRTWDEVKDRTFS